MATAPSPTDPVYADPNEEIPLTFENLASLQAFRPTSTQNYDGRLAIVEGGGFYRISINSDGTEAGAVALAAGYALPVDTVDRSLVRDDIADPAGLQAMRWAAKAASASPVDYILNCGTVSNFGVAVSLGCAFSSTVAPSATIPLVGDNATDKPNIRVTAAGAVELRIGSTLITTAGTFDYDGTPHRVAVDVDATNYTLSLDGVTIASGAHGATVVATANFKVGAGSVSGETFPGAVWDAYLHDATDANTRVHFRLDEDGGPYWNAYLRPGDPLYNASNDSGVTVVAASQDTTRVLVPTLDYADRGLTEDDLASASVRPAAYGGGVAANKGRMAVASWAGTDSSGHDFEFEAVIASPVAPGGDVIVVGEVAANYANMTIPSDGSILLRHNVTILADTVVQVIPFDGKEHTVRGRCTDTQAWIWVDGRLVTTGTYSDPAWATAGADHDIGGTSTASARWPGTIRDVVLRDNNDATNTLVYKLDERTGDYADSSGNGGAAATRNGYVGSVAVLAADGDAGPVAALDPDLIRITEPGGNTGSVGIGNQTLTATTTGNANVAIGAASGDALTTGSQNVSVGRGTLSAATTTNGNTAVGYNSLVLFTGSNTVAVGAYAADSLTNGAQCTAVGYNALTSATSASDCTAIGHGALASTVVNGGSTAVGHAALNLCTTAGNTAVGAYSADAVTTSAGVTAIGYQALSAGTTGVDHCVAVGYQALAACTADSNTGIGRYALLACTTGADNTAVGRNALVAVIGGGSNTAVGRSAGAALTTGSNNTFLGRFTGTGYETASGGIYISDGSGNLRIRVNSSGEVFLNLPTAAGTAGSLWSDAGTVKVA